MSEEQIVQQQSEVVVDIEQDQPTQPQQEAPKKNEPPQGHPRWSEVIDEKNKAKDALNKATEEVIEKNLEVEALKKTVQELSEKVGAVSSVVSEKKKEDLLTKYQEAIANNDVENSLKIAGELQQISTLQTQAVPVDTQTKAFELFSQANPWINEDTKEAYQFKYELEKLDKDPTIPKDTPWLKLMELASSKISKPKDSPIPSFTNVNTPALATQPKNVTKVVVTKDEITRFKNLYPMLDEKVITNEIVQTKLKYLKKEK